MDLPTDVLVVIGEVVIEFVLVVWWEVVDEIDVEWSSPVVINPGLVCFDTAGDAVVAKWQ